MQGASWQRCRVHYIRNLHAVVPRAHQDVVSEALRTVFALTDSDAVRVRCDEVSDSLADRFPKAADSMRAARQDVLAFTSFPAAALAQNLVEQPARTIEQRDQATQRHWDLPHDTAASAPCSPTNTTTGSSPAATSPTPRWQNSTPRAKPTPLNPPASQPATEPRQESHPIPHHYAGLGPTGSRAVIFWYLL